MARPRKEGIEFFPLNVDIDQDDKLTVTIAKFGMEGFGIVVKLMAEVYKNGYFYPWTEKEKYVFSSKINTDREKVIAVVNECLEWGFFDQKLYETHQILTSAGFQKRFLYASSRRKDAEIKPDYLLVEMEKKEKNEVNVDINPVQPEFMSTETPEITTESTQRKGKESKVNESKEKEIKDYTQNAGANQIRPRFKFNGPLNVLDALNYYQVETKSFHQLENIESYQNVLSDDLILYAIELADKRTVHYSLQCLADWNAKGYKTLADHPEHKKPERGNANEKHGQHRGRSEPPAIDVTQGRVGWIKYNKQTAGSP